MINNPILYIEKLLIKTKKNLKPKEKNSWIVTSESCLNVLPISDSHTILIL